MFNLDFSVEVVTIDLHYMTDRQQCFDLKISKSKLLWKLSLQCIYKLYQSMTHQKK